MTKKNKRGRPRKIVLPVEIIKKKRGRPPKVVLPVEIVKKKRGRPPKSPNSAKEVEPTLKKRRGRPPKIVSAIQPKIAKKTKSKPEPKLAKETVKKQEKPVSTFKDFVEAKAFLNRKESSKQIAEYKIWLDEFNQTVADNDNKKLVEIIPELSKMINKVLEEQSFRDQIYVHASLIRLMVDDEIKAVEFEPFEKGIKCKIFYNLKGLPIGLAKKQKDDVVCNKITSVLEKFVPIGFCC
jgi:hypothetical protein